ncbi:ankyrin [Lojkania enalia]|uniref:Ankyrin n=1 Tax=Lojkania enalia TaxID=147567 RepID=A0A9P4TQ41_9PLEO|nr:ankyrin [Didymosphaeria enalia]
MSVSAGLALGDEAVDEILYLARANEVSELETYLSGLAAQTKHPEADVVAAAIDSYSKNSALHYAAANGHNDVIKLLLSFNLDKVNTSTIGLINAVNDAGNTPLHWAALNGHLESVKLLIQLGADVTIINKAGHDAVFEAELNEKKDVVGWLLEAVEDLESGIGQTAQASGNVIDECGMEVENRATDNGSIAASEENGAHVEDVRRQMESIKTDGTSPGG